jgi:hypothetical protein
LAQKVAFQREASRGASIPKNVLMKNLVMKNL